MFCSVDLLCCSYEIFMNLKITFLLNIFKSGLTFGFRAVLVLVILDRRVTVAPLVLQDLRVPKGPVQR